MGAGPAHSAVVKSITFADRLAISGFELTRDDLDRPLRALHLLLAGRERRGHFAAIPDYEPARTTGTVNALVDTLDGPGHTRFALGAEKVPAYLVGELGLAAFAVRALTEYQGDSIEWFLFVNPLIERPHLYWGPVIGGNTSAKRDTVRQAQEAMAADVRNRYWLNRELADYDAGPV